MNLAPLHLQGPWLVFVVAVVVALLAFGLLTLLTKVGSKNNTLFLLGFLLSIATLGIALWLASGSMYWQLPTVIVLISLVYSATRFEDWSSILHEAYRWGWRMAAFLLVIAAALYFVAEYL